jgi:ABC-type transporter Mla MlaB component
MQNGDPKITSDMYHRIYRMGLKKLSADRIAATLRLPPRTVHAILERLFGRPGSGKPKATPQEQLESRPQETPYLDIFILPKIRYARVDCFGYVTRDHLPQLKAELEKLLAAQWKAVALQLSDVVQLDTEAIAVIRDFYLAYEKRGRYSAILDPSPNIEPIIAESQIEKLMPVFGTEKSFEETAFAIKPRS